MKDRPLDPIFSPSSIAVVGASRRRESLGFSLLHNLVVNEFNGAKSTMNVDFSMRYSPIPQVSITFEALNITNEMSERFSYNDPVIQSYGGAGPNYRIGVRYKY